MPIITNDKEIKEIWLRDSNNNDREIVKVMYVLNNGYDKVVFEKKSGELTPLSPVYEFTLSMKYGWNYNPQAIPQISIGDNLFSVKLTNEETDRHTKWKNGTCTVKFNLGELESGKYIHINGAAKYNLGELESITFRTLNVYKENYTIYFGVHNCENLKMVSFDSYINDWRFDNAENFDSCPHFTESGTGEILVANENLYNKLVNKDDQANLVAGFDRNKIKHSTTSNP